MVSMLAALGFDEGFLNGLLRPERASSSVFFFGLSLLCRRGKSGEKIKMFVCRGEMADWVRCYPRGAGERGWSFFSLRVSTTQNQKLEKGTQKRKKGGVNKHSNF